MTDQTQSAVEAMARAEYATHGHDPECNSDTPWEDADQDMKAAYLEDAKINLAALLAHLDATGWQIVPKVATDVMRNSICWEERNASETWSDLLAAAPKFPGRKK